MLIKKKAQDMANTIRLMAFNCKSKDVLSCGFGNEFPKKIEDLILDEIGNSIKYEPLKIELMSWHGEEESLKAMRLPKNGPVNDDATLAKGLVRAGGSHAKYSRGVIFWIEAHFQAGFMLELDTYREGREVLSTSSSMHNELKALKGPELAQQKQEDIGSKVYHQIATYSAQCLRKIYLERRNHRHPDWQIFCDFIERLPKASLYILPSKEKLK